MKNFWKKTGNAILGLTLTILALTGCGVSQNTASNKPSTSRNGVVYRTVDEIKESGTIHIGVFSDKSPFGYVDENGKYCRRIPGTLLLHNKNPTLHAIADCRRVPGTLLLHNKNPTLHAIADYRRVPGTLLFHNKTDRTASSLWGGSLLFRR